MEMPTVDRTIGKVRKSHYGQVMFLENAKGKEYPIQDMPNGCLMIGDRFGNAVLTRAQAIEAAGYIQKWAETGSLTLSD